MNTKQIEKKISHLHFAVYDCYRNKETDLGYTDYAHLIAFERVEDRDAFVERCDCPQVDAADLEDAAYLIERELDACGDWQTVACAPADLVISDEIAHNIRGGCAVDTVSKSEINRYLAIL